MTERPPNSEHAREEKEKDKQHFVKLARELVEKGKTFPFPGIRPGIYAEMKANDEEFPGFDTPTDEKIERCNREGIKVAFGKDPTSGNIFILPVGSNDTASDGFTPRQLDIKDGMDQKLKELISIERYLHDSST